MTGNIKSAVRQFIGLNHALTQSPLRRPGSRLDTQEELLASWPGLGGLEERESTTVMASWYVMAATRTGLRLFLSSACIPHSQTVAAMMVVASLPLRLSGGAGVHGPTN